VTSASSRNDLSAILRDKRDAVRYEVGNAGFRGRTTVEVRGDASVEARFERGEATDTYRMQLSPAELDQLRQVLRDSDLASLKSQRATAQPDEDRVHITLVARASRTEATLWYNEQWTNPALRALITAFTDLASRASGGKISY